MPTPKPNAQPRPETTEPSEEQKQIARDAETDRRQQAAARNAPTTKKTMGKGLAAGGKVRGWGCAVKGKTKGKTKGKYI